MTTRMELDEILEACDQCAGEDNASYYEHFLSCGQCREYADRAQRFEQRMHHHQELASKADDERRKELGAWLHGILNMSGDEGKRELDRARVRLYWRAFLIYLMMENVESDNLDMFRLYKNLFTETVERETR